ncbi:MAG: hypothetical protein RIC55_17860 [Pirellulaceae bacterium]
MKLHKRGENMALQRSPFYNHARESFRRRSIPRLAFEGMFTPLGYEAGDSNLRRYVANGPTNHVDPSGLQPPSADAAAKKSDDRPWVVVVTGFGRFPGGFEKDLQNTSLHAATELGRKLGKGCECIAPVESEWGEVDKIIKDQIEKQKGKRIVWIAFGAGDGLRIETVADNARGPKPDKSGDIAGTGVPSNNDTSEGALDQEVTQLTDEALAAIQRAFAEEGVNIETSDEAGDYLCESAAYLLHKSDRLGQIEVGIFIHVPANMDVKQRRLFINTIVSKLFDDKSGAPVPGLLVP